MSRSDLHHAESVIDAVQSPRGASVSALTASWCRSFLHHGLDPEAPMKRTLLEASQIAALRAEHAALLEAAGPVLDQIFRAVARSGCGVVLSDVHGTIMERRVGDGDAQGFATAGLVEGCRWSEADEGTNGIGTCLVEERPVVIHRDQHFASRNIGISCMDAPVHDPCGRLIAALDVSSCRDDHDAAMAEMIAALVRDAARRIERDYFCRHFTGKRIIYLPDEAAIGTTLLATDRDDLVIGASRAARAMFGIDDAALAAPQPLERLLGSDQAPSFREGERSVLSKALATANGNASQAAHLLGIGRATFYRRMARAGMRGLPH